MTKRKAKKNPQDATLRNIRALKKKIDKKNARIFRLIAAIKKATVPMGKKNVKKITKRSK